MPSLKVQYTEGLPVYYRPNSTDEKVLKEVLERRAYRRVSAGFDVEAGEHWLDIGANIGTFAVYCKVKGATAECYEPEPACFRILTKNAVGFRCVQAAVSNQKIKQVQLWSSAVNGNHYRGTLLQQKRLMNKEALSVANVYAGDLKGHYDGAKLDIEGSEFGLIDDGLLPNCEKICLEYHTSRDKSMARLGRRLELLRSRYEVVSYAPELDKLLALGGEQKSFHDRVIYCRGKKKTPTVRSGFSSPLNSQTGVTSR